MGEKKQCDLCGGVARMYCESDQASICCLLCTSYHSLTPWKAVELHRGPTFFVCESCVALKSAAGDGGGVRIVSDERSQEEINNSEHEVDSAESYDDDKDEEDQYYSDEDEDVDEEEAENQMVPWFA